jgi:hypothetical protein
MTARIVKGTAEVFHCLSPTGIIHHVGIKERIDPCMPNFGIRARYAFISNTNVHELPRQCRGTLCVIWFRRRLRLAIIIKAQSSTLDCTFLIQKTARTSRTQDLQTFWTLSDFECVIIKDHFHVCKFNLYTIFCRPVNQIYGPRISVLHRFHHQLPYPPISSSDRMISMRVDGPDRCNSPPTGAPKIGFGPQSYVEYICSTPTQSPVQFYPTIPTSDDEKKNKKKNKKKKKMKTKIKTTIKLPRF